VSPGGGAQATGETAPPVPSRAIAPWNRKRGDVAVEPPPPVIMPPPERVEPVKAARPARGRRRVAEASPVPAGRLEAAAPMQALPVPQPAAAEPAPARRTRAAKKSTPAKATAAKKAPAKAAGAEHSQDVDRQEDRDNPKKGLSVSAPRAPRLGFE
jgi:hypothetical protein